MWCRNAWTVLLLGASVALAAGCAVMNGNAPAPAVAPTLAPRPVLEPVVTLAPKTDNGFVPATPWPTFTPEPTRAALLPAVTVVAAPEVTEVPVSAEIDETDPAEPTPTVPRFACTVEYRRWLVEGRRGGTAPELTDGLEQFRQLFPYCGRGRFEPVFSIGRLCDDENRVAGVTVMGHLSRGRDYNHNVRLGPTAATSWGHMLIHFDRLPNRAAGGCWYYEPLADRWYEEIVGNGGGSVVAAAAPTAAAQDGRRDDAGAGDFAVCNAELRLLIEETAPPFDHAMLNELVRQVGTGLADCSVGWKPVVAESSISEDCPDGTSGTDEFGDVVVHWETAPGNADRCWIFHAEERAWDDR